MRFSLSARRSAFVRIRLSKTVRFKDSVQFCTSLDTPILHSGGGRNVWSAGRVLIPPLLVGGGAETYAIQLAGGTV